MKKKQNLIGKRLCLIIASLGVAVLLCLLMAGCRERQVAAVPAAPTGLQIEDDILTWQEDEKATGYLVSVDGEEYRAKESGFDLFLRLLRPKAYELRVRALYDTGAADSDWSEPMTYTVEATTAYRMRLINEDTEYEIAAVDPEQMRGKICIPAYAEDQKPITQIADAAFENCTGLTGVIMPNTVQIIGSGAFRGCTNLRRVHCSSGCEAIGGYAFFNCTALTDIRLPGGIDTIGKFAFSNCSALSDITLPPALTKLNASTFEGCRSLETICIPQHVESIGIMAFGFCDRLTSITVAEDNPVFWSKDNCVMRRSDNELVLGIGTGIIPPEVRTIGAYAFAGCSGLTDITIPGTVAEIRREAFAYCHNLTAVTLEEGVRSIGNRETGDSYVFRDCPRLTSLEIPASVEKFHVSMIRYCTGLRSLTVREGNATYRSEGNCIIRRADNVLVLGCTASVIPQGIREIGDSAFIASAPKDVVIPEGVEIIGGGAFQENKLNSFKLPSTLTTIGRGAFMGSLSRTPVVIPSGVKEIGNGAFKKCILLVVTLPGSVETIGKGAFDSGATIYTSAPADYPAGWHRINHTNPLDSHWETDCRVIYDCSFGDDNGFPCVRSLTWMPGDFNLPLAEEGLRVPYREGYTFLGWTTEPSGNTVQYGKTTYEGDEWTYERTLPMDELLTLTSDTVLYAVWAPSEAGTGE